MPKRSVKALGQAFSELSGVGRLRAEVELLTRYSTDVIYRLRYSTMQYDYISPAVARLLGYTPEELGAVGLRSLILETRIVSDGMKVVDSYSGLEETRRRGEVGKWQADYRMKAKDGSTLWVADISYPWFDENGAIIGSVGSLRDITQRMQAEEKIRAELLRSGQTDPVTQLAGRQAFWSQLEREVSRIRRTQSDVSLLLIDIDHFERIGEQFGSAVAERVLAGVATLLRSCLREVDVPARLGGEEFAVILPETGTEGAVKTATRIRDTVARHTFFAAPQQPVGCTVSLGVASSRLGREPDAMRLFKLADMRLYVARHTGGNRLSADENAENLH